MQTIDNFLQNSRLDICYLLFSYRLLNIPLVIIPIQSYSLWFALKRFIFIHPCIEPFIYPDFFWPAVESVLHLVFSILHLVYQVWKITAVKSHPLTVDLKASHIAPVFSQCHALRQFLFCHNKYRLSIMWDRAADRRPPP